MPVMQNVATLVPYCDVADFRTNSLGADLSTIQDPELESILIDASAAADAYCQTTYQFQTRTEKKNWRGNWNKRWEVFPNYGPIRTVTKFEIAVTAHAGDYVRFPVSVTPTQTSLDLPEVFGDIFVDREVGYIQTVYIMLKYGMGVSYLATPMNPAQVLFTYTCGYNAPDTDPATLDGYSLPFPLGLVEGTRHIAAWNVNERMLTRMGMGNLDSLKVGGRAARRVSGAGTGNKAAKAFDIPDAAKRYLKPFIMFGVK